MEPGQYGYGRQQPTDQTQTDWTTVWHELEFVDATAMAIQHYALTILIVVLVIAIWADNYRLRSELERYRGKS